MELAHITAQELDDTLDRLQELRLQVARLHATIGRMFEKGLITDDMIGEALNEGTNADDQDGLQVIFNSWGGNTTRSEEAANQFALILKTIKSYY